MAGLSVGDSYGLKVRVDRIAEAEESDRLWIVTIGAMVVIQLWFGLIASSFWLDETGTWWIVKDGAAEAVRRAFSWSGQSPLYYLAAWLSSRLFGLNEIALRIPSVLAMCGAIYFLYRIAERIFDRATAAVVAFVFLCVASFYAIDARPYALAILCLTVAIWALMRWVETSRPVDAAIHVIAGALVVYAHCILAVGLAACVVYAVAALGKDPRRLAWFGLMETGIALLSLPLVSELRTFYATRSAHTFTGLPGVGDLIAGVIPCSIAGAVIVLIWVYMASRGDASIDQKCTRAAALLIGAWALFAPVFFFLLPAFTDLRLFVDRYYSSALPGQALLAGGLLSSIRRPGVRKALILALGAASILVQGRLMMTSHGNEDWRGALTYISREAGSAPVVVISPFAEGTDFHAIRDPKLKDILFAPGLIYGAPARAIPVPHVMPVRDTANLEHLVEQLKSEPRFFILRYGKSDGSYEPWLLGRLGARCQSDSVNENFGYVSFTRFTCQRAS